MTIRMVLLPPPRILQGHFAISSLPHFGSPPPPPEPACHRQPNSWAWNAQCLFPQYLHSLLGGLEQSCHWPFRIRKCFLPLIQRNSNWLGRDRRSTPLLLLSFRSPLLELSVSELSSELDRDDKFDVEELSELESLHFPDLDDFFFLLLRAFSLFFLARRFSFFLRSFSLDLRIFSSSFKCFFPFSSHFSSTSQNFTSTGPNSADPSCSSASSLINFTKRRTYLGPSLDSPLLPPPPNSAGLSPGLPYADRHLSVMARLQNYPLVA